MASLISTLKSRHLAGVAVGVPHLAAGYGVFAPSAVPIRRAGIAALLVASPGPDGQAARRRPGEGASEQQHHHGRRLHGQERRIFLPVLVRCEAGRLYREDRTPRFRAREQRQRRGRRRQDREGRFHG